MFKFLYQFRRKGLRLHFFILMLLFLMLSLIPVAASSGSTSTSDEDAILGGPIVPTFSKSFTPNTIGPGSVSTLRFDISNDSTTPATAMAFVDNMPAGTFIATPANASSNCNGTLTAPDGGTTITLTDGSVSGSSSCVITVDVTSSTAGVHANISGDLTSSAGNSGPAAANLTVSTSLPGFSKNFSPNSVGLDGRSTLTFTIDNSANDNPVSTLSFTDNLPDGMEIANPAGASTTCGTSPLAPTLTAVSETTLISLNYSGIPSVPAVAAGATCIVSVDVIATATGTLVNSSGNLSANNVSSGKANAALTSPTNTLYLTKEFVDDPVPAGGEANLQFTVRNQDRLNSATNIAFTDDLDATLSGLTAVGLPQPTCGGTLSGTGTIALTGGNLAPSGSCTFTVTLQVPAGATAGSYPNVTNNVTATVDGSPVVGTAGIDTLFVAPVPLLTKTFLDDPIASGDEVALEFNITNSSATSSATSLAFTDELTTFLPFPISATFAPEAPCGAGSTFSLISLGTERQGLYLTGGNLSPSASCTFTTTLTIPAGLGSGSYLNTTNSITGMVDGNSVEGRPATDTLEIVAAPTLIKEFTDDPILPGEVVTLEFTIEHGAEEPGDATNITFTDDLDAVLTGLASISATQNDICGIGSQISGTGTLTFTGGSLAPGESCTFSVQLQVPSGSLLPSDLTNVTSNVTANVLGLDVTGLPAEAALIIGGITFTKSFIDDPTIPGDTVTLRFTIENESDTFTATSMLFTDSLANTLTGLAVSGPLPAEPCGAGSSITGSTTLTFTGGNLAPGTSCTFDVTLLVPAATENNAYANTTSNLSIIVDGTPFVVDPATDVLVVDTNLISLTKQYLQSPAYAGNPATLRFTLENLHQADAATTIAFTDDLEASLSGLAAVPPFPSEPCGAGSAITGTSVLSLTGGNLNAASSCEFEITVQVPETVSPGDMYENVTSDVTGIIDGFAVTGYSATDTLLIGDPADLNTISLAKEYVENPVLPGDTTTLRFTLENLHPTETASTISFTDDLSDSLDGLVALAPLPSAPCGLGSSITGTSLLTFTGAMLTAGASCTFDITLQVPENVSPGDTYENITSEVTAMLGDFDATGDPASDTLLIGNPPLYLPLILNNVMFAPDLVITSLAVNNGNVEIIVTNQGTTAVTQAFWVDLYINPNTIPTMVNETWELVGDYGAVWGVEGAALPLDAGESITLTLNDAYYYSELSTLPALISVGTPIYAQVDSANTGTSYGNIFESHESNNGPYNNIIGPISAAR